MSNGFAEFISDLDYDQEQARDMGVGAFIGDGKAIQLTLGANWKAEGKHTYICLTEFQVRKLIECLQARLDGKVTATGFEEMGIYYPNHETPLNDYDDSIEKEEGKADG